VAAQGSGGQATANQDSEEPSESEQEAVDNWQVGISPNYSSGKYGTNSATNIIYVPLSIRRLFDDGDITFIAPYVSVTGDCGVTLVSGVPNATGGTCPTVRRERRTPSGRVIVVTRTLDTRVTNSGPGDLMLQGRYYLLDEKVFVPTIAVTARVKIPTANADQGLGTGQFDEGFGIETSKRLSESFVAFADGGFTFIGKPPGVPLRNQWNFDVGLGYYVTKTVLVSVYYEAWRALIEGLQNPQDMLLALNWVITPTLRFSSALQIGLSDGAPDYGLTAGVSVRF
jgi:hypothetical protein